MKHSFIARIEEPCLSTCPATKDTTFEKTVSNPHEIKSHKDPLLAMATEGDGEIAAIAEMGSTPWQISTFSNIDFL